MFDSIKKRRALPVPGLDGVYVRLLTYGERKRALALEEGKRGNFVIGKCMVNQEGAEECPQKPDEKDEAFADRVEVELQDVDPGLVDIVGAEYQRLVKQGGAPMTQEAAEGIAKN